MLPGVVASTLSGKTWLGVRGGWWPGSPGPHQILYKNVLLLGIEQTTTNTFFLSGEIEILTNK